MSIGFNITQVTGYGTSGQDIAWDMHLIALRHSFSLTYDSSSRKFTILGTSGRSKEELEHTFEGISCRVWRPQFLDETDALGNRLVVLVQVTTFDSPLFPPLDFLRPS